MDIHTKAFELIMTHLHCESGDGDAHVHCKYISKEEMADKFEAFLNIENDYTKFNRLKRCSHDPEDKTILFSDMSNENVTFSDLKDDVEQPTWLGLTITI
jgi:hypothetical protein